MKYKFREHLNSDDIKSFRQLGKRIKDARIRRTMSSQKLSDLSNIDRFTLSKIESGDNGVSIGAYYCVLKALGLSGSFAELAANDPRKEPDEDLGDRAPWGTNRKK